MSFNLFASKFIKSWRDLARNSKVDEKLFIITFLFGNGGQDAKERIIDEDCSFLFATSKSDAEKDYMMGVLFATETPVIEKPSYIG